MNVTRLSRWAPAVLAFTLGVSAVIGPVRPAAAQDAVSQMETEYGVVTPGSAEGARLNDQLAMVVDRTADGIRRSTGKDFHVRSARILGGRSAKHDREVNAFALPDGRIYVTLGLMRLVQNDARSDDELAFVVGHEMTHVVERHSAAQSRKSLPIGILAAILGTATRNQTVGQLAQLGAAAYTSSFSRKDEYRADRGGLQAIEAAGYDPRGAVQMLKRLKEVGGSSGGPTWFASHPLTSNRIERVQEMIGDLDRGRRIPDRSDRELLREDRGGYPRR